MEKVPSLMCDLYSISSLYRIHTGPERCVSFAVLFQWQTQNTGHSFPSVFRTVLALPSNACCQLSIFGQTETFSNPKNAQEPTGLGGS